MKLHFALFNLLLTCSMGNLALAQAVTPPAPVNTFQQVPTGRIQPKTLTTVLTTHLLGTVSNGTYAFAGLFVGDTDDNLAQRPWQWFFWQDEFPTTLKADHIVKAELRLNVAVIKGQPLTSLFPGCIGPQCLKRRNSVLVEHVNFTLEETRQRMPLFDKTPLSAETRRLNDAAGCASGPCLVDAIGTVEGLNTVEVTEWFRDDWTQRASRGNQSQYRLKLPVLTNNNTQDDFLMFRDFSAYPDVKPQLIVTYRMP